MPQANLERLGLVDVDAMFRELERNERQKVRDRALGKGGKTEVDRLLKDLTSQAELVRSQAANKVVDNKIDRSPFEIKVEDLSDGQRTQTKFKPKLTDRPHLKLLSLGQTQSSL